MGHQGESISETQEDGEIALEPILLESASAVHMMEVEL